jgi:hypothetical protein
MRASVAQVVGIFKARPSRSQARGKAAQDELIPMHELRLVRSARKELEAPPDAMLVDDRAQGTEVRAIRDRKDDDG